MIPETVPYSFWIIQGPMFQMSSQKLLTSNKEIVPIKHLDNKVNTHSYISLSDLSLSLSLCLYFSRPSMSLRSSSIRSAHMTIWRPLTGTVTRQPSWVDCVAVRSRSSWSQPATRCTSASFLTPQYKGRASKLHTPQVCVCVEVHLSV